MPVGPAAMATMQQPPTRRAAATMRRRSPTRPPYVYWAFDQADISGSTVASREGSVSGVLKGAALAADGVAGDALAFQEVGDSVDFGDVLDDVVAGPDRKFTISLWIRPSSVSGFGNILVKDGPTSCELTDESRAIGIGFRSGHPSFRFWSPSNDNARYVEVPDPLVLDVWQHVLITYDGSVDLGPVDRVRLYIDGVPQPLTVSATIGAFPFDIEETGAHLALGNIISYSGDACSPDQFRGALDELAVWNTILSAEEAADVHARGAASLALWPL